jgi:mono/diheme cytochrome c family protein
VFAVALIALLGAGLASPAVRALQAQEPKTQWDGIFTEEQSKRGEPLYAKQCASCHGTTLAGGEMAPTLIGPDFSANWNNLTMAELLKRIQDTMPPENPGGLTRRVVADILAFMLHKDGAPAGSTELPTQADALNAIRFKATKPVAN